VNVPVVEIGRPLVGGGICGRAQFGAGECRRHLMVGKERTCSGRGRRETQRSRPAVRRRLPINRPHTVYRTSGHRALRHPPRNTISTVRELFAFSALALLAARQEGHPAP